MKRRDSSRCAEETATYAELEALPEHQVGEIINGELIVSPRPAPRHALAASMLGIKIGAPFHVGDGGPGGWWILDEPELHFGEDVVVPDLAGWRRERMPVLPETAWFELAPDWICEVISPSTARHDRAYKLPLYAREGVAHFWLAEPLARTLEVLELQEETYRVLAVFSDETSARAKPFNGIELDVSALWGEDEKAGEE